MNKKMPETVALLGLPISMLSVDRVIEMIESFILSGQTHQLAFANLELARNALKDEYLHRTICACSLVLPGGAPMMLASSLLGLRVPSFVTGAELVRGLAGLSARRGYSLYFLGGMEQNSLRAARVLEAGFPGVRIVGRHCPSSVPALKHENDAIVWRVQQARPDILLVAFGNPQQQIWIHQHAERMGISVVIGIGDAFDVLAGHARQPPQWLENLHLGWVHRMLQEPGRLLTRYARDAAALITQLSLERVATLMQPKGHGLDAVKVYTEDAARILCTPACLSEALGAQITREAIEAITARQILVIDFASTKRIEPDGLAALLVARRLLLADGLWIWLTSLSNPVRRLLQFSAVADLFRIAATPAEAIRYTAIALPPGTTFPGKVTSPARSISKATQIAKAS